MESGEAHKVHDGKPTVVTTYPSAMALYSFLINSRDVDQMPPIYSKRFSSPRLSAIDGSNSDNSRGGDEMSVKEQDIVTLLPTQVKANESL